jgi:hypothetical protein
MLGFTQATDFSSFCGHFFARRGEKMTTEEVKYPAAAGSTRLYVLHNMVLPISSVVLFRSASEKEQQKEDKYRYG